MFNAAQLARRATTGTPSVYARANASRALATSSPASKKAKTGAAATVAAAASKTTKIPTPNPASGTITPPLPSNTTSSAADTAPSSPAKADVPPPTKPVDEQAPVLPQTFKSLDFTSSLDTPAAVQAPAGSSGEGGRTGARSSQGSLSSIERRRRALARAAMAMVGIGLAVGAFNLGNEWTREEMAAKKWTPETAPSTRWARTQARFGEVFGVFSEPQWEQLLPPPLPAPHQKPLTLVVSLDDLLITSTWDRAHGWRTAKRPGVDYFLAYLSQFYEIVIWTSQHHYTAMPIIEKLDPYRFFTMYHLFRESTKSVNGEPVKDLSYLNRDLNKVVMLDTHPEHVRTHPTNAIVMPGWTGQPGDTGLVAMIPFLESIGIYKPADVRPIVGAYAGKDVPVEYARFEAAAKQKHLEEWEAKRLAGGAQGLGSGGFTLSALFGGSGKPPPVPPTYLEQKRAEAQVQYREEMAYMEANKGQLDKLLADERDAMMREGAGSLLGAMSALTGGVPPAPKEGVAVAPPPGSGQTPASA